MLSKLELYLVSSRVVSESSPLLLILGLITAQLNTTPISLRNLRSSGKFYNASSLDSKSEVGRGALRSRVMKGWTRASEALQRPAIEG